MCACWGDSLRLAAIRVVPVSGDAKFVPHVCVCPAWGFVLVCDVCAVCGGHSFEAAPGAS